MGFLNACHEETVYGRQHHAVIALRPVAYLDAVTYKRNVLAYESKGGLARPLVLDRAPLIAQVGNDASARFCPVRSDPAAYIQFGSPLLKAVDRFEPITGLSAASLSKAQTVAWDHADFSMEWLHAGHYVSWLMRPRKGWKLPAAIQFPVSMAGLERRSDVFSLRGVPVCHMQTPVAVDLTDPMNVVQLAYDWVDNNVVIDTSKLPDGEWEIDPTLVLQPDAAAGKDSYIQESLPTSNFGTSVTLLCKPDVTTRRFSFIFLDVSLIPAGAICSSAVLALWTAVTLAANTWTAYSLASGVTGWTELGITWNKYNGINSWATAGCLNATLDYEGGVTLGIGAFPNTIDTMFQLVLLSSRVRQWFGTVNTNHGIRLSSDLGVASVHSSDGTTPAWRSMLTVEYTLPGRALKGLLNRSIL